MFWKLPHFGRWEESVIKYYKCTLMHLPGKKFSYNLNFAKQRMVLGNTEYYMEIKLFTFISFFFVLKKIRDKGLKY